MSYPHYPPPYGNVHPYHPAYPPQPAYSQWQTLETPDKKTYYYNPATQVTSWEKPIELKSNLEKALDALPWKQHTAKDSGKKYYYNVETKETTWETPAVWKQTEETYKNQTQPPAYNPYGSQMGISSPQVLGANPSLNPTRPKEVQVLGADPTVNPTKSVPTEYSSSPVAPTVSAAKQILGANALNPKPQYTRPDVSNLPKEDELYFETKEKAEEAFIQVLVEANVEKDWTWEQALGKIITKKNYRAIKSLADRKIAFNNYVDELKVKEAEAYKIRMEVNRPQFRLVMERRKDITVDSKFKKLYSSMKHEPLLRNVPEAELELFFNEYIVELKNAERERIRTIRRRNMDKFKQILQDLTDQSVITFKTTWKEISDLYIAHPEYSGDQELKSMEPIDHLLVFEDHMKSLSTEFARLCKQAQIDEKRRERKNRQSFQKLLTLYLLNDLPYFANYEQDLRETLYNFTMDPKWKTLYPIIKDDDSFKRMCENLSGSNCLELFWDAVDELEAVYYHDRKILFKQHNPDLEVSREDKFELFQAMFPDETVSKLRMPERSLRLYFSDLIRKNEQKAREEQERKERKIRKRQDQFKYLLKKNPDIVTVDSTWEEIIDIFHSDEMFFSDSVEGASRIEDAAFKDVFDKYIDRLKEKEEEDMNESSKRHKKNSDRKTDKKKRKREDRSGSESDGERKERRRKNKSKKGKSISKESEEEGELEG